MADILYIGSTTLQQMPDSWSYNTQRGVTRRARYRGTSSEVEASAALAVASGYDVQVDPDIEGDYATLYLTYPEATSTSTPLSDQWELPINDLQRSLWEHPKIRTEIAKVRSIGRTEDQRARLLAMWRKAVDVYSKGEFSMEADQKTIDAMQVVGITGASGFKVGETFDLTLDMLLDISTKIGMNSTVASGFIKALVDGVDSYIIGQFVLRRTLVVPDLTTVAANYSHVGKLFTTATLKTAYSMIPADVQGWMPSGYWLTKTPTKLPIADGSGARRWQIVQEWWHADEFDPWLYEVVT